MWIDVFLHSGEAPVTTKRPLLGCAALLALAGSLRAEPPLPLDLVPEDACIGIGVRNLAELRTKSDRLFGKGEGRLLPRPSQLLDQAFGMLKLGWKIDEKRPSALVCMTGALGGYAANADPNKDFTVGAALAPQSLDDVARAYKVRVEDLKKGGVLQVPGQDFGRIFGTHFAGVRDGEVFLTGNQKATAAWVRARTLRQSQTDARRRRLDAADGLVYLGPPLLKLAQQDMDPEAVPEGLGPQEREAQRRINRAYLEVRNLLAGYRVDDGFGLDLSVGFDPKGRHAQAVLKAVTGAGRTSNLAGLPDSDRLVGAFAAIGLERADLHLARVLASDLWLGLRGASPVLDSDARVIRRLLGDFYSKLRLGRAAVYQSSDRARFGQLAAVAILEPNDPAKFLDDIAQYVKLGDVEQFDPKREATKAEIEKLIADLGADDFEVREAASTKLGLIGEAALPYLGKAEKSDDPEVRRRAAELSRSLRVAADLRKGELARGLVKKAFRPTFTLKLDAEKRGDVRVHLLGMRVGAEDAPFAAALKDFFGPEWNRLRMVVTRKQVIVLFGSDLALLDQAVRNVREGNPGLERSAAIAAFRKQAAPQRRLELHLALGRVRALLTPAEELPKDFKPGEKCSSMSLRTGQTDLGVDLWVPAEAVTDVLHWMKLF
jgi:hypothetical protein